MTEHIEEGALKVVEVVGISQESFEDAVQKAVKRASAKIKKIVGVEVLKFSAKVRDDRLAEFHANLKLAFVVDGPGGE